MNDALLTVGILCLLAAVIVAGLTLNERAGRRANVLVAFVTDEHERTRRMGELMHAQSVATAHVLKDVAERDAERDRLVIDALISDRQRLITALLAAGPNPNASRIVGMVDQANVQAQRTGTMREAMLESLRDNGQGPDTEYATGDGHPIVPVGMGNTL